MKLVDAHVHIPLDASVISAASRANVVACVLNSTDRDSWSHVHDASERQGLMRVCPSYGIHPWWAAQADISSVGPALEAMLLAHPVAPVGEIGLDKGKNGLARSPWDRQSEVFRAQLDIAARYRRPISVHCVQCHTELAQELEEFSAAARDGRLTGVLLHSWGGPPEAVHRIQAHLTAATPVVASIQGSIVISASNAWRLANVAGTQGPSSLPRGASKHALSCVQGLPLSMLAIETDAPDQPFLQDVHPGYVRWAAQVLPWEGEEGETCFTPGAANSSAYLVHVWRALTLIRAEHAADTRSAKEKARGVARPPSLFSLPVSSREETLSSAGSTDSVDATGTAPQWVLDVRELGRQVAQETTNNVLRVFADWAKAQGLRPTLPSGES